MPELKNEHTWPTYHQYIQHHHATSNNSQSIKKPILQMTTYHCSNHYSKKHEAFCKKIHKLSKDKTNLASHLLNHVHENFLKKPKSSDCLQSEQRQFFNITQAVTKAASRMVFDNWVWSRKDKIIWWMGIVVAVYKWMHIFKWRNCWWYEGKILPFWSS